MEHQDDPDIDAPYNPKVGNATGTAATPGAAAADAAAPAAAAPAADAAAPAAAAAPAPAASSSPAVAKSIRCVDTGKVFRTMAEAQAYAERTGNANFEECAEEKKPLTAEEKAVMMEKMQAKMTAKKASLFFLFFFW